MPYEHPQVPQAPPPSGDAAKAMWADAIARDPSRVLTRSKDLAELREAWSLIADRWAETEARARRLGDAACHERVGGEWSFVETMRHLLFVTGAWIRKPVLGEAGPYLAMALPPSFVPDMSAAGIDLHVEPTVDDVI